MKIIRIDTFFFQLSLLLGIIFLLGHVFAVMFDWYYIFPWFDAPIHILGGMFLISSFYMITPEMNLQKKLIVTLFILGIVGISVEVGEWIIDTYIRSQSYLVLQQNNWDTITDIMHNYIGGITIFIFGYSTHKL